MFRGAFVCALCALLALWGCGASSRDLAPAPGSAGSSASAGKCGGYRWPVKVAEDPTASQIRSVPTQTSIAALVALPAPSSPPQDARADAVERTTYRLTDVVVSSVYPEDDRDLHLSLRDAQGRTMIVESPDPACGAQSRFASQMQAVRAAIIQEYGSNPNRTPGTVVSVEGVGFFDFYHSQPGQARNAVELHPLTSICFGAGCALP